MRFTLAVVLFLFIGNQAEAKWHYQKDNSAFGDDPTSIAFTLKTRYGLSLNCTKSWYFTLVFVTPDKSLDEFGEELVDVVQPKLLIKIDDGPIRREPAETHLTPMGASFLIKAEEGLVKSAMMARSEITVALELLGEIYHETSFSVKGSSKQISRIQRDCSSD